MYNEKIRVLREAKGYSQEEIADMLGIAQNTYSKIERGKTKLTVDMLGSIAEILGVSTAVLVCPDYVLVPFNCSTCSTPGTLIEYCLEVERKIVYIRQLVERVAETHTQILSVLKETKSEIEKNRHSEFSRKTSKTHETGR